MPNSVVLVPGLLCTRDLFREQIEDLSLDREVRVADTTGDASLGAMAERLLAAAPPRFALAGLSMGGYVALEVVRRAPERVARLVLLDTSARADRPEQSDARREIVALARREGIGAAVGRLAPRLLAERHLTDAPLGARLLAMAEEIGVDGFERQQEAIIARADVRDELASFALPTLVVVGEEDVLTPPKLAEEMVALLPDARLEIVAGSGHMSTMERPDEVTRLLRGFLQDGR